MKTNSWGRPRFQVRDGIQEGRRERWVVIDTTRLTFDHESGEPVGWFRTRSLAAQFAKDLNA